MYLHLNLLSDAYYFLKSIRSKTSLILIANVEGVETNILMYKIFPGRWLKKSRKPHLYNTKIKYAYRKNI